MSWPAALLWVILIASALSRGPSLFYFLLASGAIGTLQMNPSTSGATNLLPQSVCAVLFVGKVLSQRGNISRGIEVALNPRKLALFTMFLAYAVCTAVVLPRLFADMLEVVPVTAPRLGTEILRPGLGNVTQTGYMVVSYATAVCVSVIGQSEFSRRHFLLATLASAYVIVLTGMLDLVTYTLHLEFILEPLRNVTYTLLLDNTVASFKRVVGLMSEASSYGSLCVSSLATLLFLRPLYRPGIQQACVIFGICSLTVMAILSTSSTAYVGLGVLGIVYICDLFVRFLDTTNPRRGGVALEIASIFVVLFTAFSIVVISPSAYEPIVSIVDKVLFQKVGSASYEERSFWTQVGWQAFLDSGGVGTGLGSIRVSNWTVSILGSTGFFGGMLMFGFILQQLIASPLSRTVYVRSFATGIKLSLPPTLIMLVTSATMPDFGIAAAVAFGMITTTHASSDSSHSAPFPPTVLSPHTATFSAGRSEGWRP